MEVKFEKYTPVDKNTIGVIIQYGKNIFYRKFP